MNYKDIKVKENTRFILCIDDNFDKIYLKDLDKGLSNIECYEVLQENFNEVVKLIKMMEKKSNKKLNIKEKKATNLKLIK